MKNLLLSLMAFSISFTGFNQTNDDPCGAVPLTSNTSCVFSAYSNVGATNTIGVPLPGCANYQGGDVWFSVTVPPNGSLEIDFNTGTITDAGAAVYIGSCTSLNLLACDDDSSPNGLMPYFNLTGQVPGSTLWIRVWEYGGDTFGTFQICVLGQSGGSGCQGGPSTIADSNVESVILSGTNGTAINYAGCPGIIGVEQSMETVTLGVGNNFQADIQFGTCGGNFPGNGEAWIDFNQNSVFEPSESIGTWTGVPPTSMSSFVFTVPLAAVLGSTKMRVQQQENSTLPLDPCAAFTWGSVVDFNVVIEPGVDCSGYIGDNETDPRIVASLPYSETHSSSICYSNQNPVYASPDVYYLVTPGPTVAALKVSLCGSSFDTFLSVMDTDGNIIAINDDAPSCGIQSELQVSTIGHDSLYIIVEGWGTQSGNYVININQETLGGSELSIVNNGFFPNPASDQIQVIGDFEGDVLISDFNGRVVLKSATIGNILDISSLPAGAYFVQLAYGTHVSTHKLIVD